MWCIVAGNSNRERSNMHDNNIDELVNNIDGAFPSARMFVKNVAKSYKREMFMKTMTPDEGRKLYETIVQRCETVPSLGEVQSLYFRYVHKAPPKFVCPMCDGNSWLSFDENCDRYTFEENGQTYTFVKPCGCRNN